MISTYRTGSSKSPNAQRAEGEGRLTWSQLTKAQRHGLTKAEAVALNLNLGEWHHTSAMANRAEYFDPTTIAQILDGANIELLKEACAVHGRGFYNLLDGSTRCSVEAVNEFRRVRALADAAHEAAEWTRK